jgi:hypothetical protein
MNKIGEYIESVFKEEQSYPGRLLISSREFFKVNELYDHLFDLKTSITSLPKENDLYGSRISYVANGDTIDLFYLLKKKISRVKLLQIYCSESRELQTLSLLQPFSSLIHVRLDMIPPSIINGLYELRGQLQSLEITNSGIIDLSSIFIPKAKEDRQLLASLMPIVTREDFNIPKQYQWLQLISLKLTNCGIVRLDESFHFMPLLASLTIDNNNITRISHLQDCYRLKFLNFSSNRIANISNLQLVLGNVKVVDLSENQIEMLAGLQKLYSLQHINLSNNRIADFDEIHHLANLPMLEGIDLRGNAIANEPDYRIQVFQQFISEDVVNRNFPTLDREDIHESELKRFKGVMFRPLAMEETLTFRSSIDRDAESSLKNHPGFRRSASLGTNSKYRDITPPRSFSYRRQSSVTGRSSSTAVTAAVSVAVSSPTKHDLSYPKRCQPALLDSWKQYRQVVNESASSTPMSPSSSSMSSAPSFARRRTVMIAVSDEDGLTIFPSLDEIKDSVRQTRERQRILAAEHQLRLSPVPPSASALEILDERQLSYETRRHVIGRLSSDDSRPLPVILDPDEVPSSTTAETATEVVEPTIEEACYDRQDSLASSESAMSQAFSADHSLPKPHDPAAAVALDQPQVLSQTSAISITMESESADSTSIRSFSTRIYSGAEEYASLDVMENLELFFREQVFGTCKSTGDAPYIRYPPTIRPSVSVSKSGAKSPIVAPTISDEIVFVGPPSRPERFMALFCEEILVIDKPKPAWRPPHASSSIDAPTAAGASSPSGGEKGKKVEEAVKMLIALTNATIYILRYDELIGKLFADAPIPILVNSHDIVDLMYCNIFFGFQRCMLSFIDSSRNSSSMILSYEQQPPSYAFIDFQNIDEISAEFLISYMIITRDKAHTYPIITKIPQISNAARALLAGEKAFRNVRISNRDDELMNQVIESIKVKLGSSYDADIVHYQMLYQTWRKHPGVQLPRTVILTPSLLLLIEEDLRCKDVRISLIDHAAARDVSKIILEENPCMITIVFKASSKMFAVQRKWRLVTAYPNAVTRLQEECRRLCAAHGNVDL